MTTKPRQYGQDTPLNEWIRNHPDLDSAFGFVATDVDLVWYNYKRALIMITEHKERMGTVSASQEATLSVLDQGLIGGLCNPNLLLASRRLHIPERVHYCGLHVIVCQNTNPDDGDIYIDGLEVSKDQLLQFLRFDWTPVIQIYKEQQKRILESRTLKELDAAADFAKRTIYTYHPETKILSRDYLNKKREIEQLDRLFQSPPEEEIA